MAKKVLSIVIGTEYTKVCEVSYKRNYKNKGIKVYRSISFPTPPNSIEDGYIKDKNAFGEELHIQLKAAKIKSDKVIFSVASSKIANREVMIPPVNERRIMDIIKTGASEYFPIDLKEYILSYLVLEKKTSLHKEKAIQKKLLKREAKQAKKLAKKNKKAFHKRSKTDIISDSLELMDNNNQESNDQNANATNAANKSLGKRHMRLSVFAVPSTLVKNYYNFASAMHFDIVSIDYSGNSSYQMIKRQANRGTNVFIQLNEQDTLISIVRDDVLILQRTVGYGISTLLDTVMEQRIFEVNQPGEAIKLLYMKNLLTFEPDYKEKLQLDSSWTKGEAAAASEIVNAMNATKSSPPQEELEARRNVRESLHFLTSSIARMLDYYKSNHKETNFDMVYLSGAGTKIQGIEDFFLSEIGINHKKMDRLWTVSAKKKAAAYRTNPSEFITCIGAVIKPIDFVPIEFIERKQKRSALIATIFFALTCIAGSAGTIYVAYTDYQIAQEELDKILIEKEAVPPLSGAHDEYNRALAERDNLYEMVEETQSNNDNIHDVINELERKLPAGASINSMQFSDNGVTMNVTANVIGTDSYSIITILIKQLKTIEFFGNVNPPSDVLEATDEGVPSVTFTITCSYN
ncbi:MAG: Tfp pilus assembly protein ATPase PilM [Herbinix sp.]|jgi:type IV pilus assembly protein PilM|nr:Tfp pilus assembly protein ATPase PilM [Herbinix sp.]